MSGEESATTVVGTPVFHVSEISLTFGITQFWEMLTLYVCAGVA